MSRKKIYSMILFAAFILVVVGLLFNVKPIAITLGVMGAMMEEWPIWVASVLCAFIFSQYKYYWPIMVICGFCASIIYQIYFFTPLVHAGFYTISVRALLFLCIVFVIDCLRLVFKR